MDWTINGLQASGFEGFTTFAQLGDSDPPRDPGVYAVFRPIDGLPAFLARSTGGTFRGDPTVAVELLQERWIPNTEVVYIGKADIRKGRTNALRKRLIELRDYGRGDATARHAGGRYLWQLPDAQNLIVAWKPGPGRSAREVERELIEEFEARFGRLPFANIYH